MKHFSDLIQILSQTKKPLNIQLALETYFKHVCADDRMNCMAILSNKRPARIITVGRLWDQAVENSALPRWLVSESTEKVRDKCEAVALLQPKTISEVSMTLSDCISDMDRVRGDKDEILNSFLISNWSKLNHQECYVFNKLITGGLRTTVPVKLMARALTGLTGIEEKLLIYRICKSMDAGKGKFTDLILKGRPNDHYVQPYPFSKIQVTSKVPVGEPVGHFFAERKFSGIRSQIIIKNDTVHIWSEDGDYLIGHFPEFKILKDEIPDGTMMEGVIIPWRNNKSGMRGELATRFSRAEVTRKMIHENPVVFMAYDLLEQNGQDLRMAPLSLRRARLGDFIESNDTMGLVQISPLLKFDNWETIDQEREKARNYGCSGVVIKKSDSSLDDNSWWSISVSPFSIRALLLYAQPGEGTDGFIYKNLSLAVKDAGDLIPLARVESHLSDHEHELISTFVKENTIERFGPVRSVKPQLVFRATCTGVLTNKRRKSGVTLQNLQIAEWCRGADPEDIDTIGYVRKLGSIQG